MPPYSHTTITRSDLVSRRRLFHTHRMKQRPQLSLDFLLEALMWKITSRGFTLQEVLIMAAMNLAERTDNDRKGERTIWRSRAQRDSRGSRRLSWQK